jgi:hypothetical protein
MAGKLVGSYVEAKFQKPSSPQNVGRAEIKLLSDATFTMVFRMKNEWRPTTDETHPMTMRGTWSVGDDGDGSWAVYFQAAAINDATVRSTFLGRFTISLNSVYLPMAGDGTLLFLPVDAR